MPRRRRLGIVELGLSQPWREVLSTRTSLIQEAEGAVEDKSSRVDEKRHVLCVGAMMPPLTFYSCLLRSDTLQVMNMISEFACTFEYRPNGCPYIPKIQF